MTVEPTRPAPLLPPGTYIEEWLENQIPHMTKKELAFRLGVSTKHLSQLINGHKPISANVAASLETVTGYSTEFWLTHQARFDARRAAIRVTESDIQAVKALVPDETLEALRQEGAITATWEDGEQLVREIYAYAKVAHVAALEDIIQKGLFMTSSAP